MTKLLRHIGNKQEVESYLKNYREVEPKHFALIKVGGNVLADDLDTLASALAFLSEANLYPVVIHGAGPQISKALLAQGMPVQMHEGLRVTTPEALYVARRVLLAENQKLVNALEARGAAARAITTGVFDCSPLDEAQYGLVGKVETVHLEMIHDSIAAKRIPIIPSLGETVGGQILNLHADGAATALAKAMNPVKVVFMTSQGGLVNEAGELVRTVELARDYDTLTQAPWMDDIDKRKLKEIQDLLNVLPASSSCTVVDALQLPKELFSHQGAGTLVRRDAETINSFDNFEGLDIKRVYELIEHDFAAAKGARVREEYIEYIAPRIKKVYVSENYTAVAVVTEGVDGVAYVDKFAVENISKNALVAETLWNKVLADHPRVFWRSKAHFESNSWFFSHAAGSQTSGAWTVFWAGFEDLALANQCVEAAVQVPTVLTTSKPASGIPSNTRGFSTSTRSGAPPTNPTKFGTRRSFSSSSRSFSSRPAPTRVGLIGARGHTGSELIRLVDQHPDLEIVVASSRALKGKKISDVYPADVVQGAFKELPFSEVQPAEIGDHDVDVWILALPNNLAQPFVDGLDASNSTAKVVDLSADFRFNPQWAYGLPERHGAREVLRTATRVANPGCYATGMQCSLLPLASLLAPGTAPTVFGVSGYSGAGTSPSRKNDPAELRDNLMPYSLHNHMHEREVTHQLRAVVPAGVRFIPHVAPWFRGISLTLSVDLAQPTTRATLLDAFHQYYQDEPLVRVLEGIPEVRSNQNQHHVQIGGFEVTEDGCRAVLTTTLDNLLKGAATQCMQNINLMTGHPELAGIRL